MMNACSENSDYKGEQLKNTASIKVQQSIEIYIMWSLKTVFQNRILKKIKGGEFWERFFNIKIMFATPKLIG